MTGEERDDVLMMRYLEGDERAFEALYARYKGPIYRYLLRHLRNSDEAGEMFQEVWIRLIDRRKQFRRGGNFKSYLFTLAHNRMVDHFRARTRRNKLLLSGGIPDGLEPEAPAADGPGATTARAECDARLREALWAIPADQRDAFLLKEESGLSLDEIAIVMGVGHETAKSRLRYAVEKLRETLGEGED